MSITPTSQHKQQAEKIMKRRAQNKSNTTGVQTTKTKAPTATELTVTEESVDGVNKANDTIKEPTQKADKYAGMNRKALRGMCETKDIEYKKKDTVAMLIAKLEA